MRIRSIWLVGSLALAAAACGNGSNANGDAGDVSSASDTSRPDAPGGDISNPADVVTAGDATGDVGSADAGAMTLAAMHPCDRGLAGDPAVIWSEDFEEGSVAAITARYESANNPGGMSLVSDVPPGSCGTASLRLLAGVAHNATDLYKRLPNHDDVYVRWYAKYQPGIHWHHTGVWFGGYNPPSNWPNPQAGLRPNGDDRFSVSIEPVYDIGGANPRFDTYDYWMGMHSWMAVPSGSTAYYGNAAINSQGFTIDEGQWVCLEAHVRLNSDLASSGGGLLEVWKNDTLVQHFDEHAPVGCWVRDKFCVEGATGPECDYPSLCASPHVPFDLQFRSTSSLQVNAFWPQNYITEGPDGAVQYDHMVVATQRVGCLR